LIKMPEADRHGHLVEVSSPTPLALKGVVPPFREVFEANVRYVYRLLIHLGVPARHVEDVCQEVFVVVSRRLHECTDTRSLRSWLYAIAWRVASAHRRKAAHRREVPTADAGDHVVEAKEPASVLEEQRRLVRLDAALATLPDDQRAVFVLYEIEQLTMREVSSVVDCSINTAFSRLYAARRRVAASLGVEVPKEVWKR
jgi:RNA polymerase sigma-70 factor, ECF subfamily